MRRARYQALARAEIIEAAQFYNGRSVGLGDQFLDELETQLLVILAEPHRHRVVFKDVRCRTLKRFPFSVLYRIVPSGVQVLAVKHDKRHPDYWKDRL